MQQNINRIVISGKPAKEQLLNGVNKVCDVVGSTMGARGSNNLFETLDGLPHITKDGVDSLNMMFLPDPVENMGCEAVKEACNKQRTEIGDNTTLVCVLTQAFFQNSLKEVENGGNEIEISQNILKSVEKVNKYLDELAIPLTDRLIFDIAKTAGNGDLELAEKVSEAFIKSGEHGSVSHGRSMTDETFITFIDGNPIESGFAHEGFINIQENQSVVFDNPLVLVSDIHFQTINEVIPFLEIAFPIGIPPRPFVIIGTMEENIMSSLVDNARKGYPIAVIKTPYFGKKGRENLSDIALVLGCEVLNGISRSDYSGKEQTYLGTCQRIEIKEKDSVITLSSETDKSKSIGRIAELEEQIKNQTNIHEINYLKERIAKINGGIATILIGGYTPSEVEERIARYDDAISAVKSAKDGVLAGGGTALLYARIALDLDRVTRESINAPFFKILSNAKFEIPLKYKRNIIERFLGINSYKDYQVDCRLYPFGYDVKEYKEVDMFEVGIVDTLKGIKTALINASSASNNLLRCNYVMPFKRTTNGN